MLAAAKWGAVEYPKAGEALARRFAHLAYASPSLFTLIGVLTYMAGWTDGDYLLWGLIWLAIIAYVFVASREDKAATPSVLPAAWLRISHGVVAATVLIGFIGLHFANHLTGLWSAETHIAVMKILRNWYRYPLVEIVLVTLMLFMVVSGLVLLRAKLGNPGNFFETVQTATGAYLLFFIPGHMNSVFIFQRAFMGKDSDFWFAAGGRAR